MTRRIAVDLASIGCTMNTVALGPIGTSTSHSNISEEDKASLARMSVLNRVGTPEEVAHGVAFLVAREASNITGTALDINGGAHMH